MKKSNLKPWQPGTSGNPNGRPKGSKSVKKVIVGMLNDQKTYGLLPKNALRDKQTPLEAIVSVLILKSIRGDVRAIDTLLKYSVDRDEVAEEPDGFFSANKRIVFEVIGERENPNAPTQDETYDIIDQETGTIEDPMRDEPVKTPVVA